MNPFEPFAKLAKRVSDKGQSRGFQLIGFSAVPAFHGDEHRVQAAFKVDPDKVGRPTDELAELAALEESWAASEQQPDPRRETAAKELAALEEELRNGGILGD